MSKAMSKKAGDKAWADLAEKLVEEDEAMPPFGFKQQAKLVVGVSAAVAAYLGFLYLVFEVLT